MEKRKNRRPRGTGSIYLRGSIFWVKYYRNGKPYRESSKSDKITKAEKLLKTREAEIQKGEIPGIVFDRVRFDKLAEDFLTDYRINKRDTLSKAERSVKYLKKFFGCMKVTELGTDKIRSYMNKRMEDGMSNASINRELAALKRIFHLAIQCTPPKVSLIPYIPMLAENNVREGFFEHKEFIALRDALPPYLKPLFTFGYHTGWRVREIKNLTWDSVDFNEGVVWVWASKTKNQRGKQFYLNNELKKEFQTLYQEKPTNCHYVFHRKGKQIKDFRGQWRKACIDVGLFKVIGTDDKGKEIRVHTKIFHDFRRTAVRNMTREGVPESVAMKISGHKTQSIFKRYDIVATQDLKDASRSIEAYHTKQETEGKKVIPFPTIKQAQNG